MTLTSWVKEVENHCQPDRVHLCDGSQKEFDQLVQEMVQKGTMIPLKRPGSFLSRTTEDDVARVEERTFICSEKEEDAGPTNHWCDPSEMRRKLQALFQGCMRGRVMYVIPFRMGKEHAVEITDSPYVAAHMRIMTHMGEKWDGPFVRCLHSVGMPLAPGERDVAWPCNSKNKYIVHFPETREVISFGSGYGGNALLGKKSFALRIASCMARDQGWLAEHMLILGVTNPQGVKKYFVGAFPSSCGKTNLAMLCPTLPGWKVECVGDDIAWMHFGEDGRLYAINPEAGMFGVAPGTSEKSNPNAMATIAKNTLFTNVALTKEGDVWWEGLTDEPPGGLIDWQGRPWQKGTLAAHPNARFAAPIKACPVLDPAYDDPRGVPISAILVGGRRSSIGPLVVEALQWSHGIFLGATISSETTAAAAGALGKLRHDPFAMLPFCGYHMGDYFAHWLSLDQPGHHLPKIFYVNWFRKDKSGHFLWPGFGENSRVLKWIFERLEGSDNAEKTAIGYLPKMVDLSGLSVDLKALFSIDVQAWRAEVDEIRHYFAIFGKKLPSALQQELDNLEKRLV